MSMRGGDWYRQPVVWLGIALGAASLAGCVLMIVLAARHADPSIGAEGALRVFDMPLTQRRAPQPP
ncbi:MAG TPA: hypothetical protein VFI49_13995 [Rudaea sp.]|nr:hypothetical protein [Rudaea sp.]